MAVERAGSMLKTKLFVPHTRTELVARPHLIGKLNEGLGRKLTLVSAPAGYGKTTLVTEWLKGTKRPFSWFSLDEGDNDPARFITYLLAALQTIDASIGVAAQAMLQGLQPPPSEVFLTSLINDMAATSQPFVLVLDDYHVIQTLRIHEQMAFLVDHQPPQMHLVIATREDPPLPLPRWRVRGQMAEIRQDGLLFSLKECADFLQRVMALALSADDIAVLEQRTEAWIAGLQLAALSMQGREDVSSFVHAFSGSSRHVLDYLIEEVFERKRAEVREFLLKTSILERLSAPLCNAVTQHEGGQPASIG
jgi:LuxR family maltose regulon positive regulatory protein